MLGDVPQLAIQELSISSCGETPLSVMTLSASTFTVLFNLLQWFFYMMSHRNRQRLISSSSKGKLIDSCHDALGNLGTSYDSLKPPDSVIELAPIAPFAIVNLPVRRTHCRRRHLHPPLRATTRRCRIAKAARTR